MDTPDNFSPMGEGMEKTGPEKKDRFLPISILVAAFMIGGAIIFSVVYHPGASPAAPAPGGTGPAPVAATEIMKIGSRDEVLGSPSAPVTIVEYGDYQCPFCTAFFTQTQSQIVTNYVNTGKAKFIFRNFPFLGPESIAAAQAAECAFDQKKLWPYHDALYQAKVNDEAKGGNENDGVLNRTLFLSLAQKVKLDIPTFTSCLDSNKYATIVTQEKTDAANQGVNSTPNFFINGAQLLGAQPYAQFQQAIEAALKA